MLKTFLQHWKKKPQTPSHINSSEPTSIQEIQSWFLHHSLPHCSTGSCKKPGFIQYGSPRNPQRISTKIFTVLSITEKVCSQKNTCIINVLCQMWTGFKLLEVRMWLFRQLALVIQRHNCKQRTCLNKEKKLLLFWFGFSFWVVFFKSFLKGYNKNKSLTILMTTQCLNAARYLTHTHKC